MRRRKKNSLTIMIFIFVISTFTLSIGYSLLYEKLSVQGTGNLILPNNDSDVTSKYLSLNYTTNSWYNDGKYYYQLNLNLENISEYTVENWKIVFKVSDLVSIQGGWNAEFDMSKDIITVTPAIYNQTILPENTINIGLQVATLSDILNISEIKLYGTAIGVSDDEIEDPGVEPEEPDDEIEDPSVEPEEPDDPNETDGELNIKTSLKAEWLAGNNYISQHDIEITNMTADVIEHWMIKIQMPDGVTFSQIWGGNYINADGTLKISGVSYNESLQPNQSINVLIQFESTNAGYVPQIIY